VASFKPSAGNLGRLLLAGSDLPDGYKAVDRTRSSVAGSCVNFGGNRTGARSNEKKLGALGFKRCAANYFRKDVHTEFEDDGSDGNLLSTDTTNTPVSGAILMRDQHAASQALPVLRKTFRASFAAEEHSLPVSGLGDEAPRGIEFTFFASDPEFKQKLFVYVWRRGRVAAWLVSGDSLGDFDRRRVLELARKLDARIAT
jgi:hypothetical protein